VQFDYNHNSKTLQKLISLEMASLCIIKKTKPFSDNVITTLMPQEWANERAVYNF